MKLWLGKPRNHWISPYTMLDKVFFWKEIDYDAPWVKRWTDRLEPLSHGIKWVLDTIRPEIKVIKLDKWDTWNVDYTLATVIHKLLIQLRATKRGSPMVDDEDVPETLRSTSAPPKENPWDVDDYHHYRWDWVLNEMIWAFAQLSDSDHEDQFYDHSNLCKDSSLEEQISALKVDLAGLEAHAARINRGTLLFGKYYRNLWD